MTVCRLQDHLLRCWHLCSLEYHHHSRRNADGWRSVDCACCKGRRIPKPEQSQRSLQGRRYRIARHLRNNGYLVYDDWTWSVQTKILFYLVFVDLTFLQLREPFSWNGMCTIPLELKQRLECGTLISGKISSTYSGLSLT